MERCMRSEVRAELLAVGREALGGGRGLVGPAA